MNAKKILSLVLVVVLSVLALTSCNLFGNTNNGPTIDDALASLTDTYKDSAGKEITKDFDVVGKVILDGAEFAVTWASNNASVVIKPSAKAGWYTVDLPEENDTPVNYKLTATITAADGATATYELALKLPVYQKAVEAVSVLEENTPYKVHIAQMNIAKHLFATANVSTSSSSGESFIKMTATLADSVDFYAEIVDGGYKFYIKDGDAKKYVTASVTETIKDEQTKYVKCLNFADESNTIFKYNDTLGIWYTTTIYGDYVLGNYGTYDTVSMSQSKYFTVDAIGNTQFVVKFITAAQAEALEPIVLPIPEEITSIADANNIAAGLAKDATTVSYYRIKGTITEIQNDYHGNMLIADENGNSILIYGLNSKDGSTKYGNMEDKPVVGDTITVVSKIKNYGGNKPELENAMLYEVVKAEGGEEGGEEEIVPVTPPTSTVPAVTGKYHLVMTQVNVNKNLYLTGATANKDYYLATTTDAEGAMLFEIEAVEGVDGAFYIFFMKDDVKTYIEVYANGSYTNLKLTTETPASYYTYDAEYNTAVCELTEGNKFFIGSYQNFETASASAYKYIPENFSIKFVEVEAPKADEPGEDDDTTVDPLAALDGKYVVNFIMNGIYTFNFNKEAGTVAIVDNNTGLFTGTFNYTYAAETGITVEGANIVFAVNENGGITVSVGGGAAMDLLVDESTDDDDDNNDDVTGATMIEPTEPKGSFDVEISDTYWYVDLYGFKAPVAGTYSFIFPAGSGAQSKESYDAFDMPEVDYYDGGILTAELEAGEVFYFYIAATSWDLFTVTFSDEEIEVIKPVELIVGENTITFTEEQLATGIECTIFPYSSGIYSFKSDVLGANIYDPTTGDLIGRGSAELESYTAYTVIVYPLSEDAVAGDYVLNVVDPIILNGSADTEVDVDADMITNGFIAYITLYNAGALSLTNDLITVESIVDPDGNALTPNADGSYDVESWTRYTVYFAVAEGAEAGTYTIAYAIATAPGTVTNPYTLADTNNVVIAAEGNVYYNYVATESGYLTIASELATLALRDTNWNFYTVGEPIFVVAGTTYTFCFSTEDYAAAETVVTVSFEAGEITEDVIKGMLNDNFFYINDEYSVSFTEGMINVSLYDYTTWEFSLNLMYSYTATMNDDGSITIVPTYVATEGEVGVDFGFSGATVIAVVGEYGYEFTCELAEVETPDEPNPDEPVVPADPTAVSTVLDTNGAVNNIALEANTYAYAELYIYGEYVITYDAEGLVVLVNNMPVESGATFYAMSPRMATIVTIYGADYAAVEAAVTIAPYVAPATELVVGENANAITTNNGELNVEFTAPAAGTYEFAPNANTTLIMETAYGADLFFGVDGDKLTLTLAEGETVAFILAISDFSADSVVTIAKVITDEDIVNEAYGLAEGAALSGTKTLTGVITKVDTAFSTQYKNVTVTIQIGNLSDKLIKCYRLKGTGAEYINVGDTITVTGTIKNYEGTIEFDSGCSIVSYTLTDSSKAAYEKDVLAIDTNEVTADTTITLPATLSQFDGTIAWALTSGNCAALDGNTLTITLPAANDKVVLTATITIGDVVVTKDFTIDVIAVAVVETTLATFEFGDNKNTTTHNDGSKISAGKTYTDGNYTLNIASCNNAYDGANDAKGTSALKLGTSKATGDISFTVADDVDKVIIMVAQYKANTTKITVNGEQFTISTASNNGAYTAVEIDTSVNKTVSLSTVSGAARAMIDSISFISLG